METRAAEGDGCSEHKCGAHLSSGKSFWSPGLSLAGRLASRAGSVHTVGCGSRRSEALSPTSWLEQGLPKSAGAGGSEARTHLSASPLPSHPGGRVPPVPPSPGAQAFGGSSCLLGMQPGQWLWVWRSREGEARDWTSVYSCSPLVQGKDRIVSGPDRVSDTRTDGKWQREQGSESKTDSPPRPRLISIESQGCSACSASGVGRGPCALRRDQT